MLLEPVVRQFAQFARLDEESAAPWVPLCEAAAAWIESMRKPDDPPPEKGKEPEEGAPLAEEGEAPPLEGIPPAGGEEEVPEPADDPRLVLAAAGEAFYRYTLSSSGGDVQSLKIGDISVSESSGNGESSGARALRDTLLAGAAGLIEPGFAGLWQVEG